MQQASYAALARCTFSPNVRTRTTHTRTYISSPPKLPDLSPRIAVGRCGSVVHSQRLVLNLSLMPEERIFILTWYSCTPYSLVYFHIIYRIIYHWPGGISCFFKLKRTVLLLRVSGTSRVQGPSVQPTLKEGYTCMFLVFSRRKFFRLQSGFGIFFYTALSSSKSFEGCRGRTLWI